MSTEPRSLFIVRPTANHEPRHAVGIEAGRRFYVSKQHHSRAAALADARRMNLALRSNDPAIQKIRDALAALTRQLGGSHRGDPPTKNGEFKRR
jgi:hypothetical protein